MQPKVVFIFFRDTNLTDTMFRLDGQFRLDAGRRGAGRRSPSSTPSSRRGTQGPWYRVHTRRRPRLRRRRRQRLARAGGRAAGRRAVAVADPARAHRLDANIERRFGLDQPAPDARGRPRRPADGRRGRLRARTCRGRCCPLMVDAREAARHDASCFVRVQRRPVGNRPPAQSPRAAALRRATSARTSSAAGHVLPRRHGRPDADARHVRGRRSHRARRIATATPSIPRRS